MAPEPLAADRTYQGLKRNIVLGRFRAGATLNLQSLAEEFGTSITPVRDAIHRMVGEGLLGVLPGGGFNLPVLRAQDLRDLYAWHEQLIRQALHQSAFPVTFAALPSTDDPVTEMSELAVTTSRFFAIVAEASGNREVARAVASASDRLSLARLHEPSLIPAMAEELEALISHTRGGRLAAVRSAVREYHRRRLRRVDRIALALRE